VSSDSKMLNPYDPVDPADRPMSSANLRTDSAEDIVLALAAADPLAFVAAVPKKTGLGALMGQKFHAFLECVLCHGEIPDGHTHTCPWYRADRYKKKRGL
jgi:hypothetical protein